MKKKKLRKIIKLRENQIEDVSKRNKELTNTQFKQDFELAIDLLKRHGLVDCEITHHWHESIPDRLVSSDYMITLKS